MNPKVSPLAPFGASVKGIDLNEGSQNDLQLIITLLKKHQFVVVKNQNLELSKWVEALYGLGQPTRYKHFVHPEHPELVRVTSKKDPSGDPLGLFGAGDLGWHTNGTARLNPENGLAIYGAQNVAGSVTSFANCHLYYESLSNEEKRHLDTLEARFAYQNNRFIKSDERESSVLSKMGAGAEGGVVKPLISTCPATGKKAFYLGVNYLESIVSMPPEDSQQLISEHSARCFSGHFIYNHLWETGDCIFADQLLTQHKRGRVVDDRMVLRTVFHYR